VGVVHWSWSCFGSRNVLGRFFHAVVEFHVCSQHLSRHLLSLGNYPSQCMILAYQIFLVQQASERHVVRVIWVAIVVVAALASLVALTVNSIYGLLYVSMNFNTFIFNQSQLIV
jgi:hypothetical protein